MREHVTWTDGRRLYDADDHRGSALTESWPLFCRGPQWFRIKGYGVRYVDHRRQPPFFSERNGYRRGLHIGPHCLMVVKP